MTARGRGRTVSPVMLTSLGRLWRGELLLIEAFWTWAVLGALLLWLAGLALVAAGLGIVSFPVRIALSVYCIAAARGVWRSAGNYRGPRRWAVLARTVSAIAQAVAVVDLAMIAWLLMLVTTTTFALR